MFITGILHTVILLLSSISVIIDSSLVPEDFTTRLQNKLVCETVKWAECKVFLQEHLNKDSVEYRQLKDIEDYYDSPSGAARKGYTELIQVLLHNGVPVTKKYDFFEESMLHMAADGGHDNLVILLLFRGADIHVKDYFDNTPLHKAAKRHRISTVKLPLDSGAHVNIINTFHETPIFLAVSQFYASPKKMNINFNNEELTQHKDELDIMKYLNVKNVIDMLLEYGADINIPDRFEDTPLHITAGHGKMNIVKLLIERGADINAINIRNQTPLHEATKSNHMFVFNYLIRMGCDKTITDSYNRTALDIAKEKKFIEVIDLLSQ